MESTSITSPPIWNVFHCRNETAMRRQCCDVLFQKVQASEADRDARKKRARRSIHSARQETNFHNLLLERELGRLSAKGEENTAAMFPVAAIDIMDVYLDPRSSSAI